MERCPICGSSFRDKEWICSACGYDASVDWIRYPTLTRSGKIPCRQHIAHTPVEKKMNSFYFQSEQKSPLQKDPNAWWKQNGWDFDTLNAEEVQQQVQKRIQKIQTEKREMRERVQRKIQTVQNQMRSEFSAQELEKPKRSMVVVQNGICGTSARWTLYNDGTIWIEGNGAMKDYGTLITNMPWKKFRNEITSAVIEKGITVVGSGAFLKCKNLSRVWMADTVQELHDYAFQNCKSLKKVRMSSELQTIGNGVFIDSALEHIDIPFGVTSIGSSAFAGCPIENIELPVKIEKLESWTFGRCYKLRNISLPSKIKSIEGHTFSSCYALKRIVIPASVNKIESYAFEWCTELRTVVLQGTNCKIASDAFEKCPAEIYHA